jgi:hypothetical protein
VKKWKLAVVAAGLGVGSRVWAQEQPAYLDIPVANPADVAHNDQPQSRPSEFGIVHPWELPPVEITGERTPALREEQRVGSYGQPLWTASRRFGEERVYVNPAGSLEFETWFIPTVNRKGATEFENKNEFEFGIPGRIQFDIYLTQTWEGAGSKTSNGASFELRYALADWDKIWGNPTLYFEWEKGDNTPDVLEFRLLLGGEIAPRWHWGANVNYEHQTGDLMTNQYEMTGGVSYTLVDSRFSVGAEIKFNETDAHGSRGTFTDNFLLGPSILFRPIDRMHVDVVPLVGLTHETPDLQAYVVLGWEF